MKNIKRLLFIILTISIIWIFAEIKENQRLDKYSSWQHFFKLNEKHFPAEWNVVQIEELPLSKSYKYRDKDSRSYIDSHEVYLDPRTPKGIFKFVKNKKYYTGVICQYLIYSENNDLKNSESEKLIRHDFIISGKIFSTETIRGSTNCKKRHN